ncbi:hypothetical protein U1Q18_019110 [Sarracenia purpurea var. burkii]
MDSRPLNCKQQKPKPSPRQQQHIEEKHDLYYSGLARQCTHSSSLKVICLDLIYDGVEEDSDEEEAAEEDDLGNEVPAENGTEEGGEAKQVSSSDVEKSEGDDDESELVETESREYEEEDKLKGPTEIPTSTSLAQWSMDAVERREFAGKKAKLAAAELAKLSRCVCGEHFDFYYISAVVELVSVNTYSLFFKREELVSGHYP